MQNKVKADLTKFLNGLPRQERIAAHSAILLLHKHMMKSLEDGSYCPACQRWAKINSRSINPTMAMGLVWLYHEKLNGVEWVDVRKAPKTLLRSKQITTLKYWGVVEKRTGPGSNGMWRVTPLGVRFVNKEVQLPREVAVYDDTLIEATTDDMVWISEVSATKGKPFDYESVMEPIRLLQKGKEAMARKFA